MSRIDIASVMGRCQSIYDFYDLATIGLQHPETAEKKVKNMIRMMQSMAMDKYFIDGKAPPKETWEKPEYVKLMKGETERKISFAFNNIKNQTVVMFHSYVELIMSRIVEMILEKDIRILKRIYDDREKGGFRLPANKIIDNNDRIISMMIENEAERFIRKSMVDKASYLKKYFDLTFEREDEEKEEVDIFEIDKLRHDIIHGDKDIIVDDFKLLVISNYINGVCFRLLANARLKFQIDVVWMFNGINYLK